MLQGSNQSLADLAQLVQALDLTQNEQVQTIIRKKPQLADQIFTLQQKMTPLMLSVYHPKKCCNSLTFKALLDATTAINAQNIQGKGVLHWLAYYGAVSDLRFDFLKTMLNRKGINVNIQTQRQETPAYMAAFIGNAHALHALIQAGADIHIADHTGRTPLHTACLKGHEICILLLLNAGAKVTAKDAEGRTPLEYLAQCQTQDPELIKNILNTLLDHGCRVQNATIEGARAFGQPETANQLTDQRVPSLLNLCVKHICQHPQQFSKIFSDLPSDIKEKIEKTRKCG